jgi:hypothetical protein
MAAEEVSHLHLEMAVVPPALILVTQTKMVALVERRVRMVLQVVAEVAVQRHLSQILPEPG